MPNLPMPDGLTTADLECVMISLPPFDIEKAMGEDWNEDDLFYGDIPQLKYAQGAVAEDGAHCTLLFGIHPSITYEVDVLTQLENWSIPPRLLIESIGSFPSTVAGQDYHCIVAHLLPQFDLISGNQLLRELPYTNQFEEYKPHITLAYIKGDARKSVWLERLGHAFAGSFVVPWGLDLGID